MKLSVSLPDDLVARLDGVRGLVPRSTWLAWVVEQALEGGPAGAVSGVRVPPAPAELLAAAELSKQNLALRRQINKEFPSRPVVVDPDVPPGNPYGLAAEEALPYRVELPSKPPAVSPVEAVAQVFEETSGVVARHAARSPVARPHLPTCRCPMCAG